MSDENRSAGTIALPARCGVSAAQIVVEAGLGLTPGARLEVDATNVERMSCAVTVALVSAARTVAGAGGALVVRTPSAAFTDAFADLGLFEALMQMEFAE